MSFYFTHCSVMESVSASVSRRSASILTEFIQNSNQENVASHLHCRVASVFDIFFDQGTGPSNRGGKGLWTGPGMPASQRRAFFLPGYLFRLKNAFDAPLPGKIFAICTEVPEVVGVFWPTASYPSCRQSDFLTVFKLVVIHHWKRRRAMVRNSLWFYERPWRRDETF